MACIRHERMQAIIFFILNRPTTGLCREEKYCEPNKPLRQEEEECPHAGTFQPF